MLLNHKFSRKHIYYCTPVTSQQCILYLGSFDSTFLTSSCLKRLQNGVWTIDIPGQENGETFRHATVSHEFKTALQQAGAMGNSIHLDEIRIPNQKPPTGTFLLLCQSLLPIEHSFWGKQYIMYSYNIHTIILVYIYIQ